MIIGVNMTIYLIGVIVCYCFIVDTFLPLEITSYCQTDDNHKKLQTHIAVHGNNYLLFVKIYLQGMSLTVFIILTLLRVFFLLDAYI